MINSLYLVEDDNLFVLIFQIHCSLLNIATSLVPFEYADDVENEFKFFKEITEKPECLFVDVNLKNSTYDGIELVRKINFEYGNDVVIGILSTSTSEEEIAKAVKAGAQFWIVKNDNLEKSLIKWKEDYDLYDKRKASFKVYQ